MCTVIFGLALWAYNMALHRRDAEIRLSVHLLALFIGSSVHVTPGFLMIRLAIAVARCDTVWGWVIANRGL